MFELEEAVQILQRTPATLAALLGGTAGGWQACDEGQDTWNPLVVVAHLIHGERTDWIPRARRIMEHGERVPFEPFDRHAQLRDGGVAMQDQLATFAAERKQSLAALADMRLAPSDLDRRGMHPALGTVTLRELLATWVAHDLGHIAQIARVMAKRYANEVGPWSAYLPILAERASGPAS